MSMLDACCLRAAAAASARGFADIGSPSLRRGVGAAAGAGSAGSAGGAGGAGGGGGGAALVPLGQPDMFRMVMGVAMVATGAIMLFITILTPII